MRQSPTAAAAAARLLPLFNWHDYHSSGHMLQSLVWQVITPGFFNRLNTSRAFTFIPSISLLCTLKQSWIHKTTVRCAKIEA